jgi:rubrerythrin
MPVNQQQLEELLYQAIETEIGGVQIYETALRCVQNADLRKEWEEYHEQTSRHVELVREAMQAFGLDPDADRPGRRVVHHIGASLVKAMELAMKEGSPAEAQVVAAECITLAETKDHLNWELVGEAVKGLTGDGAKTLRAAYKEVEDQEDEHLYHNTGWARELWIDGLGLPAVLPPPEEQKDVKTAIGAARAKQVREQLT